MIGLDTNVLLRVLVDDKSPQVAAARRFVVEQVNHGHQLYVDQIVLVELVWVLESVFGYAKQHVIDAIEGLLHNTAYLVDGHAIVEAACAEFRVRSADLSDCLIAANYAAAGCGFTATFDKAMRGLPATQVLR